MSNLYYEAKLREALAIHQPKQVVLMPNYFVLDGVKFVPNPIAHRRFAGRKPEGWAEILSERSENLQAVGAHEKMLEGNIGLLTSLAKREESVLEKLAILKDSGEVAETRNLASLPVDSKGVLGGKGSDEDDESDKDTEDTKPTGKPDPVLAPDSDSDENEDDSAPDEDDVPASEKEEATPADERVDYYARGINSAVNQVVTTWDSFFSSGYEVLKPVGMLAEDENRPGRGQLFYLSGRERKVTNPTPTEVDYLWRISQRVLNLKTQHSRSLVEIGKSAQKFVGNPDTHLYFPNKLLEYAYGRKKAADGAESLNTYEKHSKAVTWEKYKEQEVIPSLKAVFKGIVSPIVNDEYAGVPVDEDEVRSTVAERIDKVSDTLTTGLMLMKYDRTKDSLAAVKLRVMVPPMSNLFNSGGGSGPLPRDVVADAIRAMSKDALTSRSKILEPNEVGSGTGVWEYEVQVDQALSGAEPLFAYKALETLKDKGQHLEFDSLILGLKIDDQIMRAGDDIDLKSALTHIIVAGSRSGKGVFTLNLVAAGISSAKALFYFDNKPDMASLVRSLSKECFVVNGNNVTTDPDDGTDFFRQFEGYKSQSLRKRPKYLSNMSESDALAYAYLRGLMFFQSLINSRVSISDSEIYENLGGDTGLMAVVDEFRNTSGGVQNLISKARENLQPTQYMKRLDEGKIEAQPKHRANFWYTLLYTFIGDSIKSLDTLRNAGLSNSEVGKSDVFLLSQELPKVFSSKSEFDSADVLLPRPSSQTGIKGKGDESAVLSPLAIVGEPDAFFGYNKDKPYLNQANTRSKSNSYLNDKARMFGYVKSVRDTRALMTEEAAQQAKYFKTFLVFPHGDQDEYFVKNSFKFAKKAGINPKDIIARNEDPNNPGKINPAVGFKEYLNEAGVSDEQMQKNLAKSGQISNYVLEKIGYPGTWEDFVFDMDPRWLFSVDLITSCLQNGTTLAEEQMKSVQLFKEFTQVFPELFSGYEQFMDDAEDFDEDEDGGSRVFMDESVMGYGDEDDTSDPEAYGESESEEAVPYTHAGANPFADDPGLGTLLDEGYILDDKGTLGGFGGVDEDPDQVLAAASMDGVRDLDTGLDVETLGNLGGNGYANLSGFGSVVATSPKVSYMGSSEDEGPTSELDEYKNMMEEEGNTADLGVEGISAALNIPEFDRPSLGNYSGAPGDTKQAVADLRNEVTNYVLDRVDSANLTELVVQNGQLGVNKMILAPRVDTELERSLPFEARNNVANGRLAQYFDWSELRRGSGSLSVRNVNVSSSDFFDDHIAHQLGMRKFDSRESFERIQGLQRLRVNGIECTKETAKSTDLFRPQGYYRWAEQANLSSKKLRQNAWSWGMRGATDRSKSPWARAGMGTVGAVGAVAGVTGQATSKAFQGARSVFKAIRNVSR